MERELGVLANLNTSKTGVYGSVTSKEHLRHRSVTGISELKQDLQDVAFLLNIIGLVLPQEEEHICAESCHRLPISPASSQLSGECELNTQSLIKL